MAEFEQIESVQTNGGGEPPIKGLYEALKADKELGAVFSKYTPEQFEQKLKSDKNAATELKSIAVSKGLYKTDKDFDAAIFAVKPAAPVEAKKPKEEKGWISTAITEGAPGVVAKLATTPFGQSLGRAMKQKEEITGEPVKKKEGTGISYGEYKRTPLDDYEQIQQEYVQADKAYQGAKSEANRTPRELALGLTPTNVSPEIIGVRDEKRRKSDAILAKSQPEIETWVESIIGDKDKGIPSKVSLSLDLKEKTTLPRGLYRNNAGNITVDDAVTDKFAKEEVRRRGLPENGVVYKLLKNALDRRLPFELARPEIEREAERNFFKENGISITDARAKDFAKQMGGTESEQRALNERTAKLGEQIFSERDAKINELNQNLKSLQEADRKRMESDEEGMAAYNAVRDNLVTKYQDLVNKGELSAEQANAYLNSDQVNEAANRARNEVLQKKYGAKMKSDYDKYLSSFGNTNSRYKARYEREAKEAEVIANAQLDRRVAEMKLKYKPSDAFIGKYRKAYESAAKKYSDTKMSQELAREVGADAVDRITRSVMSSFGDGVRGLGQFFNMPDAEQFGEVLSSNFKGANIKLKPGAEGWKQALNPFDPAAQQSFGQLLGRMTPALATSAAVGAATGGLGFSTLGSAISAGFAGGLMETADIAGTMYNDVLEQTGSAAKASIAANAAIKSQIQIAPVYALDAFAYFPKLFRGLKYGKSVLGRSMYGAGTEYITEMLQELPQNVYEELIRKGVDDDRPYDPSIGSMLANINMERISETGKQLTGTILMGGAPSLFKDTGEGISKQLAKRAAQAYYAKNIITNASHPALILENQSQFLQKAFDNKGKNFANAMIGTFLINGNLSKEQAQALTVSMDNYEAFNKMLAQQKRQDINPLAKQALFTLYNKWMTARASKNEEATQKALADFQKLYTGGGADLLLVRLADGSTNVYTYDDFDTLLDNEKMQELVRQQGFEITPFSQTPNDPQVAAMNQRLQEIFENGPQAAAEREDSGFTSPDDEKILEGQKRTGFQVVSPLANLPEEIQAALQAATDNQEGFDPQAIRDASNYLYRLYNITTNLKKSTTRNLTRAQIADQMEELGTALDLLGNYYNRLATGEMEIQEEVEQQDGAAQAEQPQAPGTQRPPLPGTPQVKVLTDDEILARMTEEERDGYYDFILKGDKDSAQAMIRGMRNEILGAEQQMGEVRDAAAMVQKALEESGVEVTMVDNPEEFDKLIRENGGSGQAAAQGMFFAPSGKIFINRSLLRGRDAKVVVWHEGTHPVMNIIRNTNPELYDKVVTGLKKAALKNKDIARIILDAKRGEVDPARQDDEAIVETIGQIADGSILLKDIPTTLRDALVELINKIAAVFGLPQIKVSDVVAFKKLAADISAVLKGDKKLEEVVGKENIREYQDLIGQVESRGQARRTVPYKGADKLIEGFYSPLERTIEETKFDKLPAKQWVDKFGGSEEAKWTGLRDWLEKQTGSLNKQELLDFIKDNRIEIVTVAKGEDIWKEVYKTRYQEILDGAKELKEYGISLDQIEGKKDLEDGEYGKLPKNIQEKFTELAVLSNFLDEAKRNVGNSREVLAGYDKGPKFSQYQLEGDKENYKEVLVTLPIESSKYSKAAKEYFSKVTERENYRNSKVKRGLGESNLAYFNRAVKELESDEKFQQLIKEEELLNERYNALVEKQQGNKFKSSHFDEPNILVHLRMNTRTDADGNKVLFLEEVQSDWGQEGKKNGFGPVGDFDKSKIKTVKVDERFGKTEVYYDGKYIDTVYSKSDKEAMDKATQVAKSYHERATLKTPSAPFVMDTNTWVKLGLKTALQEAVRQGADKIAWTTGTQQFDRWGTEKIDWIKKPEFSQKRYDELKQKIKEDKASDLEIDEFQSLTKSKTGGWTVNIQEQFRGTAFEGMNVDEKALSERGTTITSKEDLKAAIDRNLSREKTESERQKLTDRIWERMQNEDKGTSLPRKEGMESFYGTKDNKGLIGGVAEKLFGQKVGEVRINKAKYGDIKQKGWVINIEGDIYEKQFDSKKEAEDFVETPKFQRDVLGYEYVIKENPNIDLSTQSSISITPELKAQVEKGLPQFRKATPAFSQLDAALALSPVKSKEARSELIDEYGKETVDQMIEITRNFEKIINGLEEQEVVTKDCP